MKTAALYHLLNTRAKKIEESAPSELVRKLSDIQRSLKIEFENSSYQIAWEHGGKCHSLTVPNSTFHFYIPGDRNEAAAPAAGKNYRLENWRSALSVWVQITGDSGIDLPASLDTQEMGLAPASSDSQPDLEAYNLLPALAAGLIAGIAGGAPCGAGVAIAGLSFILLAHCLRTTHLRRPATFPENAVIAAGCLVPIFFSRLDALWVLPWAGVALACWAEQASRPRQFPLWLLAGALCGVGMKVVPGSVFGGAWLALALSVTAFAAPIRMPRLGAAAFAAGAAAGAFWAFSHTAFAHPLLVTSSRLAWLLAAALSASLYFSFILWWVHGTLFNVIAWFSILAMALTATAAVASGDPAQTSAIGALSGIGLFLLWRIALALKSSRAR